MFSLLGAASDILCKFQRRDCNEQCRVVLADGDFRQQCYEMMEKFYGPEWCSTMESGSSETLQFPALPVGGKIDNNTHAMHRSIQQAFKNATIGGILICGLPIFVEADALKDVTLPLTIKERIKDCQDKMRQLIRTGTRYCVFLHPKLGVRTFCFHESCYWKKNARNVEQVLTIYDRLKSMVRQILGWFLTESKTQEQLTFLAIDVLLEKCMQVLISPTAYRLIECVAKRTAGTEPPLHNIDRLIAYIKQQIVESQEDLSNNETFKLLTATLVGFRTMKSLASGERVFLTDEQLAFVESPVSIQVVYGAAHSGRTTALQLKLSSANCQYPGRDSLIITRKAHEWGETIERQASLGQRVHLGGTGNEGSGQTLLFFDGFELTPGNRKMLAGANDSTPTFCILTSLLRPGLDHPRNRIEWHRLTRLTKEANDASHQEAKEDNVNVQNDDEKSSGDFIEQALFAMSQFYPNWTSASQSNTICVPAFLDIFKRRYIGPPLAQDEFMDDKSNLNYGTISAISGDNAETAFLDMFQRSQLGGFLIANFDSKDFSNKQKKAFDKKVIQPFLGPNAFECDFIFVHHRLGIIVVEIKGTKSLGHFGAQHQQYKKAKEQIEKIKTTKLPALFNMVVGSPLNVTEIPVHGIICFPYADLTSVVKQDEIDHIDGFVMNSVECFTRFWQEKEAHSEFNDLLANRDLQRFTAALAGFRSSQFICHNRNTLDIYKTIDRHAFVSSPPSKRTFTMDSSVHTVFLSAEQLTLYECDAKCQVMVGAPGTGKTLLLLLKALKTANEQRGNDGRVLVVTRPALIGYFRAFFKQNKTVRPVIVIDGMTECSERDQDDYFRDEEDLSKPTRIHFLKRRAITSTGKTVLAMTGAVSPALIVQAVDDLRKLELSSELCAIFDMKTVIRGTRNIIDYWRGEYQERQYEVVYGHSIVGQRVEEMANLLSTNQVLSAAVSHLRRMLLLDSKRLLPSDIAVITENVTELRMVQTFLADSGIACGSVEEQQLDPSLVAVDYCEQALSFEWPVVLALNIANPTFNGAFSVIACSRAIARLIILFRDCSVIQNKIDEQLSKLDKPLANVAFCDFLGAARSVCRIVGETEDYVLTFDVSLAMLRRDYIPMELRSVYQLKDCQSFTHFLEIVAGNQGLLLYFILNGVGANILNIAEKNYRNHGFGTVHTYVHNTTRFMDSLWPEETNRERRRNSTNEFFAQYATILKALSIFKCSDQTITFEQEDVEAHPALNAIESTSMVSFALDLLLRSSLYHDFSDLQ